MHGNAEMTSFGCSFDYYHGICCFALAFTIQRQNDTKTHPKNENTGIVICTTCLLKASHLLSCLCYVNIRVFAAFPNPEIFPTQIYSNNTSPSFPDLTNQFNPIENQLIRAPKSRPEPYLSKPPQKSAYNNILRKQKAIKNMNYSFDIHPIHQQAHIQPESPRETTPSDQKDCIFAVIKCKKSRARQSNFAWTKTEEKKYIGFLRSNEQLFGLTAKERKDIKINVLISGAVRSRTPAQCHSHHQKMMLKHGNIQNIITRLTEYILSKTRGEAHIRKEERLENTIEKVHSQGTMEAERQIQLNYLESKPQAEPAWWQYLSFMDHSLQQERQSLPWNQQPFFF